MKTSSEVSPEILVDSLTSLPIEFCIEYQKFISEKLEILQGTKRIQHIFHHLNLHCLTFIDYQLLEFLVNEYGCHTLKQDMLAYTRKMGVFMDETTVLQLKDHWPGQCDIPPHFEELRAVIDRDPKMYMYTLRQVDDLRKSVCSETRLSETIRVLIGIGRKHSFVTVGLYCITVRDIILTSDTMPVTI
jgi:hypothetical protein